MFTLAEHGFGPIEIAQLIDLDDLSHLGANRAAVVTKKTWDTIPPETQEAIRASARETGKLIKADGRRENLESIEAMRKRGLKVHSLTPELDAEWDQMIAKAYAKVRGTAVPADIYDEVVSQLKTFRAAHEGAKQ